MNYIIRRKLFLKGKNTGTDYTVLLCERNGKFFISVNGKRGGDIDTLEEANGRCEMIESLFNEKENKKISGRG